MDGVQTASATITSKMSKTQDVQAGYVATKIALVLVNASTALATGDCVTMGLARLIIASIVKRLKLAMLNKIRWKKGYHKTVALLNSSFSSLIMKRFFYIAYWEMAYIINIRIHNKIISIILKKLNTVLNCNGKKKKLLDRSSYRLRTLPRRSLGSAVKNCSR